MAEQIRVPASGGGLVRYFDVDESKIQIRPEIVILMIVAVILFSVILRIVVK
ncbi:MAG TPA: preprotein translocase subunit Sec61beta [Candidatus Pacearchaeota archaeon]|nr:preprotein translocase subunit Sec61beta [Candidatus Pacearchaeota archaeon]